MKSVIDFTVMADWLRIGYLDRNQGRKFKQYDISCTSLYRYDAFPLQEMSSLTRDYKKSLYRTAVTPPPTRLWWVVSRYEVHFSSLNMIIYYSVTGVYRLVCPRCITIRLNSSNTFFWVEWKQTVYIAFLSLSFYRATFFVQNRKSRGNSCSTPRIVNQ